MLIVGLFQRHEGYVTKDWPTISQDLYFASRRGISTIPDGDIKRIFSGLILDFWLLEIGYYLIIGAWLLVISLGI
jgi:hypothetical protein